MQNNGKTLKAFIPPIGLMVLITISSSIPMDTAHDEKWYASLNPNIQNIFHIPIFALLSYLWARTFRELKIRCALLLAIVVTVLFGCLDELHQIFVAGRYAGLLDILLNTTGAIIGALAFKLVTRRRPQVSSSTQQP